MNFDMDSSRYLTLPPQMHDIYQPHI